MYRKLANTKEILIVEDDEAFMLMINLFYLIFFTPYFSSQTRKNHIGREKLFDKGYKSKI